MKITGIKVDTAELRKFNFFFSNFAFKKNLTKC